MTDPVLLVALAALALLAVAALALALDLHEVRRALSWRDVALDTSAGHGRPSEEAACADEGPGSPTAVCPRGEPGEVLCDTRSRLQLGGPLCYQCCEVLRVHRARAMDYTQSCQVCGTATWFRCVT